jgi:bifunctional UDP-N-acetylglucosamine pyrophosphorylase/glucosamine-1-phosphate N-acetyltransferase
MSQSVTFVILAAGLGTRMKSRQAKVLHRAGGRTLLEHVVDTALQLAPPGRVFAVLGHQEDSVRAAVAGRGIGFIRQAEQRGTGHAVKVGREALSHLGGGLVVLYGDCPLIPAALLERLIATQMGSGAGATIVTAIFEDAAGYGRVMRDAHGDVRAVVEQKAGTPEQLAIREGNVGIYCFDAPLFWKHVDEIQPNNPAQEYYLTDMVEILIGNGHRVQPMTIDDPSDVLGINDRLELAVADRILRDRKVRELMLAGVTIEKPETVSIDSAVQIGIDTVVEPFTRILGATRIGEACRIGACSIIRDSELGDRVTVEPFTMVNTSRVEEDAEVGPYARLRMENHLEPGAHVGNFVELKKTRLGRDSKAMHLTYLGDSSIGARVNVGAGTITCNYDGVRKHPTVIGDGAFVGSNSILVAPVEIGPGAYTAAGSVITEGVPADALAVGRARQTVKPGWARQRRERVKREKPEASK